MIRLRLARVLCSMTKAHRSTSWRLAPLLILPLAGCATGQSPQTQAHEPVKSVDMARLYTGRWYEVGREPTKLTDGCVAGTTSYLANSQGQLVQRDACRTGTPEGKERAFQGTVAVLDPGENNKILVRYKVWYIFTLPYTYWILDHGTDYRWFIVATPDMHIVSMLTRTPNPPQSEVEKLTARVRALGYEGPLEYPARFPPGSAGG
ncbi:MAG: lipocalin family protein [Rhodospirillales bacterium]|nr:lipocalin family protein [Rhodospirillales bacterium]